VLIVLGEEISHAQSASVILDKYRTASIPLVRVRYVHTINPNKVKKPSCGCKPEEQTQAFLQNRNRIVRFLAGIFACANHFF
jgi:hypothetical protein